MSNIETKVAELLTTLEIKVPEIDALREALNELRKSRSGIQSDIEDLYRKYEVIETVEMTERQIEVLDQEKEGLVQEIELLGGEKTSLEDQLDRAQAEAARISQEIEKLQGERESIQEVRVLEEKRREVEQDVLRLQGELDDRLAQIEQLQNRIAELTRQLDETAKYTSYVILPWDNLWNIARRYYRDGTKWELILAANETVIDDIYNLQPYTEIKIPRMIVSDQN